MTSLVANILDIFIRVEKIFLPLFKSGQNLELDLETFLQQKSIRPKSFVKLSDD